MSYRYLSVAASAFFVAVSAQAVMAAPVYWTSPSGSSSQLTYSDGQSDKGLYGNPTVVGSTFQFLTPTNFEASASGNATTTSDRLSFQVSGKLGGDLTSIRVTELGDYSILGNGGAVKDTGALYLTNLTPGHFGVIYTVTPTVSYTDNDTMATIYNPSHPGPDGDGTWKATYLYSLPAGVKSLQVVLNNILQASAPASTTSFIQKKSVSITVIDPFDANAAAPEPASLAVLAIGFGAALRRRRSPAKAA